MLLLEHSAILLTCIFNLSDVIINLEDQFLVFFLSSGLRQVLRVVDDLDGYHGAMSLERPMRYLPLCFRCLRNNKIYLLESGCFDNLTSLESLKLNKNKISKLQKDLFANLSKLHNL